MWKVTTLLCILIGAMLPLSLVDSSVAAGLVGAIASISLMAAILAVRPGEMQFLQSVAAVPVAVACMPLLWIVIQMLPLPFLAHPIWAVAAESLGDNISGSISIDTGASFHTLLLGLASLSTGMAVALAAVDPRRARWMADVLIATATALAAASIWAYASAAALPAEIPSWQSDAASAVLICLPGCFAAALETTRSPGGASWLQATIRRRAVFLSATLLNLGAIFVSGRWLLLLPAGAALSTVLLVWVARRFVLSPRWAAAIWSLLAAIGTAATTASRPSSMLPMVLAFTNSANPQATPTQLAATLAMISDVPWAGTGAATSLLPTYLDTPGADHLPPATAAAAALVSFGPIFFWAMMATICVGVVMLIMSAVNRGRNWVFSASTAGALVALVATSFAWSITDPTVTIIFLAVMMGMSTAQSVGRQKT